MDLVRELRNLWNMRVMVIPIVIGALGTIPKALILGTERVGNQDDPKYSIVEISQDTEKSHGDLKRLVVTQTPVKDHHQALI